MNDKPRLHWVEPIKTLLIILLAASAVYLLTRTSLTNNPGSGILSSISSLLPGAVSPDVTTESEPGGFVRPTRMAVMNGNTGRYGIQYDRETMDSKFGGALLNLVSDALAGAGTPHTISSQAWLGALSAGTHPGVYLDFLGSIPATDLSVWLGGRASNTKLVGELRRLLLTVTATGGVTLYYHNETDGSYYACDTSSDLAERLAAATVEFEPNGARFAFEDSAQYEGLSPETLILPSTPTPPIYTASNPIPSGSDTLRVFIQDLTFHPQSNIVELNDLPFREGTDTLRISSAGVVTYYSAGTEDPRFPVGQSGTELSRVDMVNATWALLESCMTDSIGEARLYLSGFGEEDAGSVVYFSYQLNGVGVQVGGDGYAARVVFRDGRISAFTLQMRHYEDAGSTSIVLPEVQAVAAMEALDDIGALDFDGTELILCYVDQGSEIKAGWVAA